jgi:hypothetical protein
MMSRAAPSPTLAAARLNCASVQPPRAAVRVDQRAAVLEAMRKLAAGESAPI